MLISFEEKLCLWFVSLKKKKHTRHHSKRSNNSFKSHSKLFSATVTMLFMNLCSWRRPHSIDAPNSACGQLSWYIFRFLPKHSKQNCDVHKISRDLWIIIMHLNYYYNRGWVLFLLLSVSKDSSPRHFACKLITGPISQMTRCVLN